MMMRVFLLALCGLIFGAGCQQSSPPVTVDAPTGTVTIQVKAGQETQTIEVQNVAQGTTLESVMRNITEIPVVVQGSGTTAFVESIGDTATSQSKGWIFKVDGEYANQGVGKTTLSPPTTITWSFGDYEGE